MRFRVRKESQHIGISFSEDALRILSVSTQADNVRAVKTGSFLMPIKIGGGRGENVPVSAEARSLQKEVMAFCAGEHRERFIYLSLPESFCFWCADTPDKVRAFKRDIEALTCGAGETLICSQRSLWSEKQEIRNELIIGVRAPIVRRYLDFLGVLSRDVYAVAPQHLAHIFVSSNGVGLDKRSIRIFLGMDTSRAIFSVWHGPKLMQRHLVRRDKQAKEERVIESALLSKLRSAVDHYRGSVDEIYLCGKFDSMVPYLSEFGDQQIYSPRWNPLPSQDENGKRPSECHTIRGGMFDESIGLIGLYQRNVWKSLGEKLDDADKSSAL